MIKAVGRWRYVVDGAIAFGALIGAGVAFQSYNDNRYVFAATFAQHQQEIHKELNELHIGQLETRRVILQRELYEYQRAAQHSPLDALSQRRMDDVEQELRRVENALSQRNNR